MNLFPHLKMAAVLYIKPFITSHTPIVLPLRTEPYS